MLNNFIGICGVLMGFCGVLWGLVVFSDVLALFMRLLVKLTLPLQYTGVCCI